MKREKTIIRGLMLLAVMWLAGSCSNDEEPEMRETEVPVGEVRSFSTYFDEYLSMTRSWEIPTGYDPYEDGAQTIGIAFTQDGKAPIKGLFFKGGDKWNLKVLPPASEEDIKAGDYYLYGYIPYHSGVDFKVTLRDEIDANYSTGAKVVLENVPSVVGNDLCVVIGAKHGFDQDHDGEYIDEIGGISGQYDEGKDTRTNRLSRGDFLYKATNISKESGAGNYVFLLFDHLYAALHIKMKVYDDYAALRTIKLKKLKLCTKASGSTSLDKTDITIDLQANGTGSDPIQTITYTPKGNEIGREGIEFWKSAGEALTTDFKTFTGHFMPSDISTLVLTSEYDVLDTQDNVIRVGCKATNTLELSELWSGQTITSRGKKYTVNMTIQPTYLYVLSEPDLDSPTVTVN